ncbi:gonadotropin-releasing hormone receptor [Phlebotomus papatasi]|uniref:gonadotropin-releasing hormone receptor n=1 Tax=Phlebotomus papatasi TaxID=29031 RepID=UPI0024840892|nr:gonadotropin-releasing hormone receptor [Phlebotomus papatasi]
MEVLEKSDFVGGGVALNSTIIGRAPQFSDSSLIKTIVLSLMGFAAIVGNLATIWSIRRSRSLRRVALHNCTSIYQLITHLCIADLLVSCFCLLGDAAWTYTVEWKSTDFMCRALKYFQMFSLYLSTYVLLLIGIDRWMAVKHPMKSFRLDIRWRIVAVYLISLIFSIPQMFVFSVKKGPFTEEFHQCVTYDAYESGSWQEKVYSLTTLIIMFIIPLGILVATYLASFREIAQNEQLFTSAPNTVLNASLYKRQKLLHRAKMKSFRMSVIIILAFLICWTPYYVMMLIFLFFDPGEKLKETLLSVIFFYGMSNSLINPMIYGFFHILPRRRRLQRNIPKSEPTIPRESDKNSLRKFSISSLLKQQVNSQNTQ